MKDQNSASLKQLACGENSVVPFGSAYELLCRNVRSVQLELSVISASKAHCKACFLHLCWAPLGSSQRPSLHKQHSSWQTKWSSLLLVGDRHETGVSGGTVGVRLFWNISEHWPFCLVQPQGGYVGQCTAMVLFFDVLLACLVQ